jgi:hypothetical protein
MSSVEINNEVQVVTVSETLTVVDISSSETSVELYNGAVGPTGAQGTTGTQGTQGLQGIQGLQGLQGKQGNYTVAETAPLNPQSGDTWYNSTTSQMYIYYDSYWVETSSSYLGPTGIQGIQGTSGAGGGGGSAGDSDQTILPTQIFG